MSALFHLVSCGYHYVHPGGLAIDRPRGAGNFAFVFFRSKSEVIVEGVRTIVPSGTHILFHPESSHRYAGIEPPFVNDWLHCEGAGMEEWLRDIHYPINQPVKAIDSHLISRCIIELQRISSHGGQLAASILDLELRSLFMKICNSKGGWTLPEGQNHYYGAFVDLRSELHNSPQIRVSVEELAARVNMSKSYFQHVYKQFFGVSVMADIIRGRLEYAQYLLVNSRLSVAEISVICGYDNDTHFMRQFKKFIGVTPRGYRVSSLEKKP